MHAGEGGRRRLREDVHRVRARRRDAGGRRADAAGCRRRHGRQGGRRHPRSRRGAGDDRRRCDARWRQRGREDPPAGAWGEGGSGWQRILADAELRIDAAIDGARRLSLAGLDAGLKPRATCEGRRRRPRHRESSDDVETLRPIIRRCAGSATSAPGSPLRRWSASFGWHRSTTPRHRRAPAAAGGGGGRAFLGHRPRAAGGRLGCRRLLVLLPAAGRIRDRRTRRLGRLRHLPRDGDRRRRARVARRAPDGGSRSRGGRRSSASTRSCTRRSSARAKRKRHAATSSSRRRCSTR